MTEKSIFCVLVSGFLFSTAVQAQMVDMLGSLGIQQQMVNQSAKQVKSAMNMMQQNEILNKMNLLITEIQINKMGNYTTLSRASVSTSLSPLEWNIGPVGQNMFFVDIKNLDNSTCNRLFSAFPQAVSRHINNGASVSCRPDHTNEVKFIFK